MVVTCIEKTGIIAASPEVVYEVVADVARYPEFLEGVESVRTLGDVVEMTVRLGPITVSWLQRPTYAPHRAIDINLVSGPFRRMDVHWTFEAAPGGTRVTHITVFEPRHRFPGLSRLMRRAIEANAELAIAAFRRRILDGQIVDNA